jgi:hypothetical protein
MQTNCVALAKIVKNSKLNTVRILFSFDLYNKITVRNAALVTGDLCNANDENMHLIVAKAVQSAKQQLCTNKVLFANDEC